jgi:hypothetical protein
MPKPKVRYEEYKSGFAHTLFSRLRPTLERDNRLPGARTSRPHLPGYSRNADETSALPA